MATTSMRRFWDARAEEDPLFFVDNRRDYQDPDAADFWAEGVDVMDGFQTHLGLRIDTDESIVEIGCGVGRLTRVLATRAARVTAIDVSSVMLDRARELNPGLQNVEWRLGDGATLAGVGDAQVDGCFSFVTFQHIPDPEVTLGYIREMGRVLRPGGWAAFQLSTATAPEWQPGPATRFRHAVRGWLGRGPRGQGHPAWIGSTVAEADVRREIRAAGLELQCLAFAGTLFSLVLATKTRAPAIGE